MGTNMNTVIKGALALALLASTAGAALAQESPADDHDRWHNAGERPRPPQRQEGPRPEAPRPEAPRAQPQAQPQAQVQPPRQSQAQSGPGGWQRGPDGRNYRGEPRRDGGPAVNVPPTPPPAAQAPQPPRGDRNGGDRRWDGRGGDGRGWDDRARPDTRNWDNGRDRRGPDNRPWNDNRYQDRDHRQDRPRYDPRYYPRQFHSPQRYRGYNYRPPPGFYSRSWVFGDILPRAWWTPDYRLNSWWDYGLPIPPIGYEWVRVGDDALLVDIYSGRVVQVAYDIFW